MAIHRLVRGLAALLIALALPAAAIADGKIFSRYATAVPTPIPDQQAIIVYDAAKQMQTLAIETRFTPAAPPGASNAPASSSSPEDQPAPFAWVVPLPGPDAPTIRAATTGLFPTVRTVFQPRIVHGGGDVAFLLIVVTALVLIGLLITMLKGRSVWTAVAMGMFIAVILIVVMLPALGTARSSAGGDSLVQILDRTTVGSFDITVIGASAPGANADPLAAGKDLAAWLKANGFQMPTGVEPVLDRYASRKWVFAACKLRETPDASGPLAPHPLIFTFKTPQCVYPLELTGVGNGPLSVDLYVFSNQRAAAPNFDEVRCQNLVAADFTPRASSRYRSIGRITLTHPLLNELTIGTTVATKLSATLSPQQQQSDAVLAWSAPSESGALKYSKQGASNKALDFGSGALLITLIVLIVIAAAKQRNAAWVFRKLMWGFVAAFFVGGVVYVSLQKVEIVEGGRRAVSTLTGIHPNLAADTEPSLSAAAAAADGAMNLDLARSVVRAQWEKERKRNDHVVVPREEDSPLNYIVREGREVGSIEYVWFDVVGTPEVNRLWPPIPAKRSR